MSRYDNQIWNSITSLIAHHKISVESHQLKDYSAVADIVASQPWNC